MLGTYCPHFTRFRPPNTPSRRPPTTNRAKSDSITGHLQSHRPRIRCLYATDSHCRHQACCCTASITEDSSRRSEHLKDATRLLPRAQWVACSQAPLMAERPGLMSCAPPPHPPVSCSSDLPADAVATGASLAEECSCAAATTCRSISARDEATIHEGYRRAAPRAPEWPSRDRNGRAGRHARAVMAAQEACAKGPSQGPCASRVGVGACV